MTGRDVPEQAIVVDAAARWAMTVMDDVIFLLHTTGMVVVRPCAYCGIGRFESVPIASRGDLGYALTAWQPYHPECAPADPNEDASW